VAPLAPQTAPGQGSNIDTTTARDRSSPLAPGDNARQAVDPLNAALNYAYGLLEGQCRQALSTLGFDDACGFLHLDKAHRDSLVYDLMECERGTVDGLVLDLLIDGHLTPSFSAYFGW
jgi:CRISPR/Cas system-associated endonuclease Cas1